jgi:hypothetical protein
MYALARTSYADYVVDWADSDSHLLLAGTLLDPTQASDFFAPQGKTGADATRRGVLALLVLEKV